MLCVICLLSDSIKCKFLMGRKTNFFFFPAVSSAFRSYFLAHNKLYVLLVEKKHMHKYWAHPNFPFCPSQVFVLSLPASPRLVVFGIWLLLLFFLDGPRADFWATYGLFLLVLVGFLLVSALCMFSDLSLQVRGFSFDSDLFCLFCFSRLLDPCCSFWCFKLEWWLVFGPVAGSDV